MILVIACSTLKSYDHCLTSNFEIVLREAIKIKSSIFVYYLIIQKIKSRDADKIRKVFSTAKSKGET